MIDIQNLSQSYGERKALNSISMGIKKGENFAFLGPNGGGKTTLFRVLTTLIPIQSGKVEIAGFDLAKYAANIRRKIGVVFQSPSVDRKLTVKENLRHHGHLYSLSGTVLTSAMDRVLDALDIRDRENELVEKLSGGLVRRLEIAKGLLHEPEILFMDEPSTGLDPVARRELWVTVRNLRDRTGMTVVFTTHILEEADQCDRVAILHQGNLLDVDRPENLKKEISSNVVNVYSNNLPELLERIQNRFGMEGQILNGSIRIETENGPQFLSEIMQAFASDVTQISVRQPSLEDVFIHRTGQRLESSESAKGMKGGRSNDH